MTWLILYGTGVAAFFAPAVVALAFRGRLLAVAPGAGGAVGTAAAQDGVRRPSIMAWVAGLVAVVAVVLFYVAMYSLG